MCPPSLPVSLESSSETAAKAEDGDGDAGGDQVEREIHVSLIAVTEEGEQPEEAKPATRGAGKGGRRGAVTKDTTNGDTGETCYSFLHLDAL